MSLIYIYLEVVIVEKKKKVAHRGWNIHCSIQPLCQEHQTNFISTEKTNESTDRGCVLITWFLLINKRVKISEGYSQHYTQEYSLHRKMKEKLKIQGKAILAPDIIEQIICRGKELSLTLRK